MDKPARKIELVGCDIQRALVWVLYLAGGYLDTLTTTAATKPGISNDFIDDL